MAYSVVLTPFFQTDYILDSDYGFRIRIEVSVPSADLIALNGGDTNVFRYVRKPARPDGVVEDVFSGVCSWPDYIEMPVTTPDSTSLPANFRLNYIDLVVESETVANEIWLLIQTQVSQLMQTIKDGQTLGQWPASGVVFTATSI